MPIARALLSVSDKTGLLDFAKGLAALGVEEPEPERAEQPRPAVIGAASPQAQHEAPHPGVEEMTVGTRRLTQSVFFGRMQR